MIRILFTVLILLLPVPVAAFEISATCTSESGSSEYYLNLSSSGGTIRYKFMGQDVIYKVKQTVHEGSKVFGLAEFDSSITGETRGTPFMFEYNLITNSFSELNITANCKVYR